MSYAKLREKTPKNYNAYELMSAMQKFIRRSMEKEALFCFYEMESAGLFAHIKNRLHVTVYEDVGIANKELLFSIDSMINQLQTFYSKKNGAWRLVVANIILSACRGDKTRIADTFACSVAADISLGYRVDFDDHDFVYDMHTSKGKKLGRGLEHFHEEASVIIESTCTDDYRQAEIDTFKEAEVRGIDVFEDYRKPDIKRNKDLF